MTASSQSDPSQSTRSSKDSALIVIDVQNDFCPAGALAVAKGDRVVAPINALSSQFSNIILTQDWHPANHVSFADNQAGKSPFETLPLSYGNQTLWPVHCVQGSHGAEFHNELDCSRAQLVVRKGFRSHIDSYSAFYENDKSTATGLNGYLKDRGISKLVLAGLATDFCVAWSAIDAVRLGFDTTVVLSACAAIDLDGSLQAQLKAMQHAGVYVVDAL